jgi:RNA polymerase primary sigma factor
MDPIKAYIKDIRKIPLLTAYEEVDLAKQFKNGNLEAKDKMIRSNLRLVISIAKRYMNLGMPLLDLIEEGNIGLMKAVDKFNYRKGFRFSTYAAWWIKQSITRSIFDQSRTVRLPVYMSELIAKWKKTNERLTHKYKRIPTTKELAKAMKLSVTRAGQIYNWMTKISSLDAPISDEGEGSIIDLVANTESTSTKDELDSFFVKERVERILEISSDREKEVLDLRFGLTDGVTHTLAEVAKRLSISRERVRQIEESALKKMKNFISKQDNDIF